MIRRSKGTTAIARAARFAIERLERRAHFTVTSGTPAEASLDAGFSAGSLGVNFSANDSYRTAALWTDLRKGLEAWAYPNSNGTVLSGADLAANGYPSGSAGSNGAYTTSRVLGYPDGTYKLCYQGAGTISVDGSGSIVPGSTKITTVNGVQTTTALVAIKKDTAGQLNLYANNFTTANPLQNLHLMMPGYSQTTTQVLNPAVLARLKPFTTLRLMDLFKVNNSSLSSWANRPLPTDFTQTGPNGISYETAIALANQVQTDVWWNVPIDANDQFVTNLANLIKYGSDANGNPYTSTQASPVYPPLNPNLKVHIELANEIFNPGTTAQIDNHTAAVANVNAGILDGTQSNIDGEESLLRLHQIHDLFAGVYSTSPTDLSSHIGFVFTGDFEPLAGGARPFTTGAIQFAGENNGLAGNNNPANWGPLSSWLEAVATSGYHGLLAGQQPTTLNELFTDLNSAIQQYGGSAVQQMVAYAQQASINLPLYAYEGAVTLTPYDQASATLYAQAANDPRMDAFYQTMLDQWYSNGGKLFNQYSFVDEYNYFGNWGLLPSQDLAGNSKFDGVIKRLVTTGDANLDGTVDFADFLALKTNWQQSGRWWTQGDFTGDGTVNLQDLQVLQGKIDTSGFSPAQLSEYNSFISYATSGTTNSTIGTGLHGSYYSDQNQTTQVFSRTDPVIDFTWDQSGTGPDPTVGQASFSARWSGQIEAPTSESYTFHTYSDDGIRVYVTVNGTKQLVIDDYTRNKHEDVGNVALQAGQKYDIEVDYFQQFGGANVKLQWQTPTIPQQDVPTMMMYPAAPPAAVGVVTPSAAAGSIGLSWASVAGATSYNVYRSTSPGGEGTTAYLTGITGSGATVTTSDTKVTPGRTYYYTVTAINAVGEGAPSAEVSGAATVVAGAPASAPAVTATSGAGAIVLRWPAITGATSYSIYRSTGAGAEQMLISGVTAKCYSDYTALAGTKYFYTVTADNASGTSTFSNEVNGTAAAGAAPSLTDSDIGGPGQSGSATYDGTTGTYTIKGGGSDIYGVGDQFNFDYQSLTGDQTLITRVGTETATDFSTKAGLMLRQGTGNAAAYADILITPGQGVVFEWRDTINGSYQSTAVAGLNAPTWLKLTRSGNTFTGFYSSDGINWTTAGSRAITMSSTLLGGMAVSAHNNNLLATATFTNVRLGGGPAVTIAPAATLDSAGKTAALSVLAGEPSGAALTYTWATATLPTAVTAADTPTFSSSNGTSSGSGVTATFTKSGTYGLTVTIADAAGQSTVVPLNVTVGQVVTSITVTPASPVSVPANGTLTFAANALDQFGIALKTQPAFAWSVDAGGAGTIGASSGICTASATAGATATVRATSGTVSGSASVTTSAATPTKLSGTIIGTAGSYDGVSTREKAFDGSLSTFFDASGPDGNFVGLNLGSANILTSIVYAPRAGFEFRMTGGVFQASNDPTFATGVAALGTIASTPASGYSTITFSNATPYKYVRYLAPAGSYGNIAEMQVFGYAAAADTQAPTTPGTPTLTSSTSTTAQIAWAASTDNVGVDHYAIYRNGTQVGTSTTTSYTDSNLLPNTAYSYTVQALDLAGNTSLSSGGLAVTTPNGPVKLSGTVIGTSGSWDGLSSDTAAAAFDGSTTTFFDAPAANASNATIGLDLGSASALTSISYAPRVGFENRMIGGYFQASNSADFSGASTLFTISSAPPDGLTNVAVTGSYRYVRYVAPANSYGNIAEMQVFGGAAIPDSQAPTVPGTPTLTSDTSTTATIGWAASTDNVGVHHYVIYRNGTQVGTSTTTSFSDSGLTGGSSYSYTVAAVDAANNASAVSGALVVTTPVGVSPPSKLSGTIIGTTGSWDGQAADSSAAVFDGNTNTFFDAPAANASSATVGLSLGGSYTLTSISYAPRVGFENRMIGGYFQGSTASDFSGATTLFTVSSAPADGLTSVAVNGTYQYVRYVAPANSYGNIAEMQVFGRAAVADSQAPTAPGTPTLTKSTSTTATLGWAAATDNVGVDHYAIYRNGTQVGTSIANSFTDTGLTSGSGYSYTVIAVDAANNASVASGALAVTTPNKLTGTVIGTSGSYDGLSSDNASAVFDGNTNTFFDAPAANASNAWVGLDLGTAHSLTSISFAPRVGFESRMTGGYFQVSNTADFSGATTVYTVTATPSAGLTTVAITGSYRFVRYVAPANSYGNIAELQVFGN